MKAVPDLVEEIELTPDETDIDREFLKFVLNEWDAQALEEALLVKDASGAEVVAVGLVITGVQASDDLDGQLPPMLGAYLGLPHVSVGVAVEADGGAVTLRQEF